MSVEKKILPAFKIYSPINLSKEWFVYWNVDGKRYKRKGGINRLHSFDERMTAATSLIKKLELEFERFLPLRIRLVNWLEGRRGVLRKKSFDTEYSRLNVFLVWIGQRAINNELILSFFREFSLTHEPSTCFYYRRILNQGCGALGMGHLMKGVEKFKFTSKPAKYFQRHQVNLIKDYLVKHDPQLWLASQFLYFCFIRPKELRFLKIGDIHFDEWKICVPKAIAKNKKQEYVTIPKAFRSTVLPLMGRGPSEFIIYSDCPTKPVSYNYMSRRFRIALKAQGFDLEYKFYSWKHTGAVAAVKAGISLKELQIQLRHHSLDEVDKYLRQLGVWDLETLEQRFPAPGEECVILPIENKPPNPVGKTAKM